ncbi:MAG: glycosyltransferase [Robiginitomaculum sp.]|nr:MAG: glycosyltransferase [Robiginitomaculum sp.]
MGAQQKLIQAVPRGQHRRSDARDAKDWRVNPRSYEFCGALFDPLTPTQTLERCKWMSVGHEFRYIVTPNVDHLVRLHKEPELYTSLYQASWLSVCDSRILELLAKFTGIPLRAVPGSDLTTQIFDNLIAPDQAVNVIGGDDDVIAKVIKRYGLKHLTHHQPPMGLRNNPEAINACAEFIATHPARYTFICVGSPQQEMIAKAALERGDCAGLGLCIGASLDFLAGKVKRAPLWMQNIRMEWLYRLLSEPRRLWRRYLIDGPRIFLIWSKWIMKKYRTR